MLLIVHLINLSNLQQKKKGSANGNNIAKSFNFKKEISLKLGDNFISILGATVGFPVMISKLILYYFISQSIFSSSIFINVFFFNQFRIVDLTWNTGSPGSVQCGCLALTVVPVN